MDLVKMITSGGAKSNSHRVSQRGGNPSGDLRIYQNIVDNYIGVQTKGPFKPEYYRY